MDTLGQNPAGDVFSRRHQSLDRPTQQPRAGWQQQQQQQQRLSESTNISTIHTLYRLERKNKKKKKKNKSIPCTHTDDSSAGASIRRLGTLLLAYGFVSQGIYKVCADRGGFRYSQSVWVCPSGNLAPSTAIGSRSGARELDTMRVIVWVAAGGRWIKNLRYGETCRCNA